MKGGHVGGDAELYALGVLEPHERDAVDAHLATCERCSRAVGAAEHVALALDGVDWDARPSTAGGPRVRRASPVLAPWLATAAALALAAGLGGTLVSLQGTTQGIERRDDLARSAIVNSHFLHARFVSRAPNALAAKVLYARDGSWLYVIVDGHADGDRVTADESAQRRLATFEVRGDTSVAFVRGAARPHTLEIRDATGAELARADLAYPK